MSQIVVHQLIATTAREMCGALYELLAKDDDFYKEHSDQIDFMNKHWGKFVIQARATLACMLGEGSTLHNKAKEEIYEALIADTCLPNMNLGNQIRLN